MILESWRTFGGAVILDLKSRFNAAVFWVNQDTLNRTGSHLGTNRDNISTVQFWIYMLETNFTFETGLTEQNILNGSVNHIFPDCGLIVWYLMRAIFFLLCFSMWTVIAVTEHQPPVSLPFHIYTSLFNVMVTRNIHLIWNNYPVISAAAQ